jgi:hypothetical protein
MDTAGKELQSLIIVTHRLAAPEGRGIPARAVIPEESLG